MCSIATKVCYRNNNVRNISIRELKRSEANAKNSLLESMGIDLLLAQLITNVQKKRRLYLRPVKPPVVS